jgi:hypothetical protein
MLVLVMLVLMGMCNGVLVIVAVRNIVFMHVIMIVMLVSHFELSFAISIASYHNNYTTAAAICQNACHILTR